MHTFFYITDILFDSIRDFLNELFSFASSVTGALALAFLVVIIVSVFSKGVNKKFFINNKKFIIVTLVLEVISTILSSDVNMIKTNLVVLCISVFLIIYKLASKPKKKETKIVDVEVEKTEETENEQHI